MHFRYSFKMRTFFVKTYVHKTYIINLHFVQNKSCLSSKPLQEKQVFTSFYLHQSKNKSTLF
eukprot:GAHX01005097.1.p1 GENE.GAHX01005097.1~~GAHX01005097.1.p1  ORF type:complete len:62 (+),score=1.44 GAHX01005097.1:84-269(+)